MLFWGKKDGFNSLDHSTRSLLHVAKCSIDICCLEICDMFTTISYLYSKAFLLLHVLLNVLIFFFKAERRHCTCYKYCRKEKFFHQSDWLIYNWYLNSTGPGKANKSWEYIWQFSARPKSTPEFQQFWWECCQPRNSRSKPKTKFFQCGKYILLSYTKHREL